MEQHFRPTVADPGYDVVTENRYFVGPATASSGRSCSFSVNGSNWGANRPPFPLLQAEKVLSLPLQLRFGDDYRYRLARASIGSTASTATWCGSSRSRGRQSLYRGTVWIDRRTFARVKVQAVQTDLSAPVVSNEEMQRYATGRTLGRQPSGVPVHRA